MPGPGFTKPDLYSTCAVALAPVARDVVRTLGTGVGWLITGRRSRRAGAGTMTVFADASNRPAGGQ
jgi:hypothetical protein